MDLLSNLGMGATDERGADGAAGRVSNGAGGEREFGQLANPLVAAANGVLNLVGRLRVTARVDDLEELSRGLAAEVRAFEARALASGVGREEVIGARYCLCTVVDEAAAQTPWGSQGNWSAHSLLVQFHNETWGGEKFYQLLARLAKDPKRHHDLIEFLYFCTALGFEGQFRVVENGVSQLETLRRRVASILDGVTGERDRRLSPHWQGVAGQEEPWRLLPPWVVAVVCAVLAFLVFAYLTFSLAGRSDLTFARLTALSLPEAQIPAPVARVTATEQLRRFLEAEIREGLLQVNEVDGLSVITLLGDGLFDSASVEVKPRYVSVLARVALALDELDGAVLVKGYTDSLPIRSVRYPSNWHLSQARAEAVAAMLGSRLSAPNRLRAIGRGDADPVAGNDTAEGRARNRRVDIVLALSGEAIHRQLNAGALMREGAQ